jgi:LPS export ABC transporter protein LptC
MQAARLALLLAVGAFLAINLMRSEQQAGRPATQGTFSATVRNMFVTETDDMGRLSLEMWAEAGWQHPDRSILLRTVHIRYHDPRQPKPWLLRANEALISADHSRVDLHGAVEAEILPRGRTVPMLMDTEALTAWPDEKRLVSEVGVMLHDKTGTWLHSQNLYYESNGLLRLSGHVRGHLVAIQHR